METLLTIVTIMQRAGSKRLLLKIFSRLMLLLWLVITSAIMVSATFIVALFHTHVALIEGGTSQTLALIIIACAALLIMAMLIAVIVSQLKGLRRLPKKSPLMDSYDAFIDGLMAD